MLVWVWSDRVAEIHGVPCCEEPSAQVAVSRLTVECLDILRTAWTFHLCIAECRASTPVLKYLARAIIHLLRVGVERGHFLGTS